MSQSCFEFDPLAAADCDRSGFEIGWDHAHHGLVPPPELLLDGTPLGQGWRAGRAVFGRRTLGASRSVRDWLALRTLAWKRGIAFEGNQVGANYLAQIEVGQCPVTRRPLGGVAGSADAARIARLNPEAGFAAGNLAVLSVGAARSMAAQSARTALRHAARVDAGIEAARDGESPDAAWRLAVLMSFVTPLPFAEAARIPLRVLPPNRVRILNAVQGLQALVTMQFASPGWAPRLRAIADLLPAPELRHDFNLVVGAIAPRLLEAEAGAVRHALEDAWGDERVQRRWQHFAFALGEAATARLLERAAALGGVRTLVHESEQATEGWSLASQGRVLAPVRRVRRPPVRADQAGASLRG
jgi:hypothetical protein